MITIPAGVRIYLACGVTDMRRGFDGLSIMAQDVLKGRRTEIDFINGYIAAKGAEIGVPAPANARITELVTAVERGQLTPSPALLGG